MRNLALLVGGALPLLFGGSTTPFWASPARAARVGKIAFDRDGSRGIYVVNPVGSGTTRLRIVSQFRRVSWYEPAWSPDGERLALLGSFYNGTLDHDNRIYVRAPGGRTKDVIAVDPGTGGIAWSPDGKRLATDTGLNARRLTLVNVATDKTRLVSKAFYGFDPAWSPDGAWICFRYGVGPLRDGYPIWRGLAVVHPNGRGFRRLALGGDPSWSPDGKQIAFTRLSAQDDPLGIWVTAPDGSHLRRLTHRDGDGEPAWSPSGSQIVFTRAGPPDRSDLWIMRRDGSHQIRLIANGYAASWQPPR